MNKTKILLIKIITLVLCTGSLAAQDGYPYMDHIDLAQFHDRQIFDIEQDIDQVMLFATRKGIYCYDSDERKLINTPNIPLELEADPLSGIIYIGCRNDIAFIQKGPDGQYKYTSLFEGEQSMDEFYMISQDQFHIYIAGENNLYRFRKNNTSEYIHYSPDSTRYFAGMIKYHDRVFINVIDSGLFEVADTGLIWEIGGDEFGNTEILFSFSLSGNDILIGTDNNELFRYNGESFNLFEIEDQQYIDESILSDGIDIDTNKMALSTLLGGCLIIDKRTGKTIHTINIRTGLPDDEINSIGKDRNKGIWLSHAYGLTRIATGLPVRNYNSYPGITGIPVRSTVFGSELYVSTNEGVFYLAEKKDYITREVYVKVQQEKPKEQVPEVTEEETMDEEIIPDELEGKLSKREIRKLRRQLKKEEHVTEEQKEQVPEEGERRDLLTIIKDSFRKPASEEEATEEREATIYKKQKIYDLQSISHEFVKIPGFNKKADFLVNFQDRILAGGPAGLYEIKDHNATPVFSDWNVEFIKVSETPGKIFVITDRSTYLLKLTGNVWEQVHEFTEIPDQVFSVSEENGEKLWFGCDNLVYSLTFDGDSVSEIQPFYFYGEVYDPVYTKKINDTIFFFLASGIYTLSHDTTYAQESARIAFELIPEYHFSEDEIVWCHSEEEWFSIEDSTTYNPKLNEYLNLFEKIQQIYNDDQNNLWIIHGNGQLDKIITAEIPDYHYTFSLFLSSVTDPDNIFYDFWDLSFSFENRSIVFNFSAPSYLSSQSAKYQYYIEGVNDDWSSWIDESEFSFPMIFPGRYYLHVRARDILGKVSNEFVLSFTIRPPFWLTWWFLGICGLILVSLVFLIIKLRVRKLQRDKRILEEKVRERTAEIQRQKNEIEIQKQEIMDSIHYAQRIQSAVLPTTERINHILPENFILFLPRDIVSGDFYWMTRQDNYSIFAAVDCTGHGVPGAFMSMLGVSFLNEIVNKTRELKANTILEQLRTLVKTTLSQSDASESKDGMDIALCVMNHKTLNLQYAGAFNPLYLIRKKELQEFKADRMPIGIYHGKETSFTNYEIKLQKGDCLYIFSDGYIDQIGGDSGKKFLSKTMKNTLLEIHHESMPKQKEILNGILTRWMGKYQQVDDILIIGIRA